MNTRIYPLPAPPDSVLSSFALAYDVGRVFTLSGLPQPTAADLGVLRELLLEFVYDTDPETGDELLDGLEKARAEEDRIAGELAVTRVDLPAVVPLAPWELELLARADADDPRTPEQVAHDDRVRRDNLMQPLDEDQPTTSARGHGQCDGCEDCEDFYPQPGDHEYDPITDGPEPLQENQR